MPQLDTHKAKIIFADPPFFMPAIHYQSRISWGRAWGDLSILGQYFYSLCNDFKKILNPQGHLFTFCNDESYPVFYPGVYGIWDFSRALIWDKTRVGLGKIFRHQYEMILWASNKGADVFNDGQLHSDLLKHPPTLSKNRLHPVEKPQSLYKELISVCSRENDLIIDSFLGSGTSMEAAKEMNRYFIGIEIEEKYCEIAVKRLAQEVFDFNCKL